MYKAHEFMQLVSQMYEKAIKTIGKCRCMKYVHKIISLILNYSLCRNRGYFTAGSGESYSKSYNWVPAVDQYTLIEQSIYLMFYCATGESTLIKAASRLTIVSRKAKKKRSNHNH